MKIDILTLFPDMFTGPFTESIVKRALDQKIVQINIHNLRSWAKDKRRTVDDRPYGGNPGMILMIEPLDLALQKLKTKNCKTILLSPRGEIFKQKKAESLSKTAHLILICGHYEGVDERIKNFIDEEISIGDFILTGGELPAMIITDAITRLLPGVFTKKDVTQNESFSQKLLEYPQYTKPQNYKGLTVPAILLSGNHRKIKDWQEKKSLEITRKNRPDLL